MAFTNNQGKTQSSLADINVTPLVDVVLVLLIIFMVVTPMLTKGYPVPLPNALDPEKKPDNQKDIILSITGDTPPAYYLSIPKDPDSKIPLSIETIEKKLKDVQDGGDAGPMYIKAAKTLDYGTVKKAMLLCEATGFRSVSLVAEAQK